VIRVAVLGGGVSGLASAYCVMRALEAAGVEHHLRVYERAPGVGGTMGTDAIDGYRCEWGPNGFLDNEPATLALLETLGMTPLRSSSLTSRRYLWKSGRMQLLPLSPPAFLGTGLLSPLAKLRVLTEVLRPARRDGVDESVADFARRRLGDAFVRTFVDPMVTGIYAGDAERLSVRAAMPKLAELEDTYGGLFRGMVARARERKREGRATDSGAAGPGGVLHGLPLGMGELVTTLRDALGDRVVTGATVTGVFPAEDAGFEVVLRPDGAPPAGAGGGDAGDGESRDARAVSRRGREERVRADVVVSALPADSLAAFVRPWRPSAARALEGIPTAPVAVVCLGFDRDRVRHPLDGFGMLIPRDQGLRTLGVLFSSTVFEGRAPEGKVLVRAMIGGAHDPAVVREDEAVIVDAVRRELDPILGLDGTPDLTRVYVHGRGIPQYTRGHLDRVAAVDALEASTEGLFVTGNSVRGVAVNACVKDAYRVAEGVTALARARRDDRSRVEALFDRGDA